MWNKKGYVVYGEMVDFYLCHGIQMTHIYCIITFRVENWLKPYIELNTKLQNEAKRTGNALGITVFKGMNNFIYGKFLQNVFKQMNLKFLNTIKDAIRTQSMPGFVRNTSTMGTSPLLICTMRKFTVTSQSTWVQLLQNLQSSTCTTSSITR